MFTPKSKVYFILEYYELNKLVTDNYGVNYSFLGDIEANNDTDYTYNNMEKRELETYERADITNFLLGNSYNYIVVSLLQDMVNRDIIPEGDYLISVSW